MTNPQRIEWQIGIVCISAALAFIVMYVTLPADHTSDPQYPCTPICHKE